MKRIAWLVLGLASGGMTNVAMAGPFDHRQDVRALNCRIAGHVDDFTQNSGVDRRIWSPALCQKRDLYVYTPPGFDPTQAYPIILYLHGFMQDEQSFVKYLVEPIDRAMRCGRLPAAIVAAPDGSLHGKPSYFNAGSFFVNSKAGDFEDYIINDVWSFLIEHYPIRPEREAHVIAGSSMGGFGAYNLSMKHPDMFKTVGAMFPPLNLRWVNCRGRYMANFDPCCWGWRTQVDRGHEVVGRYYHGLITIRLKQVIDPLFGKGPEALQAVARENPIEMIDRLGIRPGIFDMFIGYGGKDEFNIDAQVESFLYLAKMRGLEITVVYDPNGRHNVSTALKMLPSFIDWLAPRLPGTTGNAGITGKQDK